MKLLRLANSKEITELSLLEIIQKGKEFVKGKKFCVLE